MLFPSPSQLTSTAETGPGVIGGTAITRELQIDEAQLRILQDRVTSNQSLLPDLALPALDPALNGTVNVLLSDSSVTDSDNFRITGVIEGDPLSSALIVLRNGYLNFVLRTRQGSITGVWKDEHTYQVKSVLSSSGYRERPPTMFQQDLPKTAVTNSIGNSPPPDSGEVVDLLVVHTADAATRAGGVTLLEQNLALAVDDMNVGLTDSDIDLEIRLTATEQITYQETNNTQLDLDRLISTTDGIMDEVHALRDSHKADLVMLVIGDGDFFCGRAVFGYYTSGGVLNLNPAFGFSVLAEYCVQTTIFAHELGHNFGAEHERASNNSGGIFSYSHGFTSPSESWHTIMSNGCNSNCASINRWSNPSQLFNNEALGIPIGTTGEADNATSIAMTKTSVANFRQSNTQTTVLCNGLSVTVDLNTGGVPTTGDDVILGTSGADVIVALGGNDTICSQEGDDIINAGPGNDWVDAGAGDDRVFGLGGADIINGGIGADEIVSGAGEDLINGDDGNDVLNGGPDDDIVNGGSGDDDIFGQGGNDILNGENGNDFILGVDGADEIKGGHGNDILNGGSGNDIVNGGGGADTMYGLGGNDTLNGGFGGDSIFGQLGDDTIVGGGGDDQLFGNEGDDVISVISGINVINGGPGNDTLTGGSGDDQIFGDGDVLQAGNDIIDGRAGADLLIGFAGNDTITSDDGTADTVNGGPGVDLCTADNADTVFNCP